MARSRSSTEARGRTTHTRPGRRRRPRRAGARRTRGGGGARRWCRGGGRPRTASISTCAGRPCLIQILSSRLSFGSGARRGPHEGNTEMQGSGGGATERVCGGVDDGSLPSSFATAASPPSVRYSSDLWSRDGAFVLDCAPAPAGQMSGASIAPPAGGWRRRYSNGWMTCLPSRRSPAPTRPGQRHRRNN